MFQQFTEFWKDNPYSKFGILVWALVSIWIWWFLASVKLDLIFSVLVASFGFSVVLSAFRKAWPDLESRSVRIAFALYSVSAFFYTSIIAGDWDAADKISFTCFGTFHLHHWFKYMLCTAGLICIPAGSRNVARRRQWARRATGISAILFIIAFFSVLDMRYFPGNRSLEIEFFILALLFIFMSLLVRSREFSSNWFRLFLVISIAVSFGIFANGTIGIINEFSNEGTIPSSLIFFNDSTCEP